MGSKNAFNENHSKLFLLIIDLVVNSVILVFRILLQVIKTFRKKIKLT